MPSINIHGEQDIQIYYETYGNFTTGPEQRQTPLLYILGLGSDTASWEDISNRLAAGRPVIVCDNRGAGRSSQPAAAYTIEAMAQDILAVLDHIEIPQVHILGHSMGGFLALELAAKHPERVAGLVLSSTALTFGARNTTLMTMYIDGLRNGMPPEWITADLAMWLYSPARFETPDFLDNLVQDIMQSPYPQTLDGFAGQTAACTTFDGNVLAPQVQAPALIIWGDQDILTSPKQGQALAASLATVQTFCIEEAAHLPHRERPDAFCSKVLDFLDSCDAGDVVSERT